MADAGRVLCCARQCFINVMFLASIGRSAAVAAEAPDAVAIYPAADRAGRPVCMLRSLWFCTERTCLVPTTPASLCNAVQQVSHLAMAVEEQLRPLPCRHSNCDPADQQNLCGIRLRSAPEQNVSVPAATTTGAQMVAVANRGNLDAQKPCHLLNACAETVALVQCGSDCTAGRSRARRPSC